MRNAPFYLGPEKRGLKKDSVISSNDGALTTETGKCPDDDLTKFTLQEMLKRQPAVSGILTIRTGLNILSNAFRRSSCTYFQCSLSEEELKPERAPVSAGAVDQLANFITWNPWKSFNISYFLHTRTARLVSGASMIFFLLLSFAGCKFLNGSILQQSAGKIICMKQCFV
ncbi:uncharacterized protein [Euphorbia lathyris]|uniref:uncharacterized protein n=1 Tax=Euphorbia lathyris TaxID=212925 RepID=UPI003314443C